MATFLTTKAIGHHLEETIINAKKNLYLITPYLAFSELLYERLKSLAKTGVAIHLVYGKEELKPKEERLLWELNCNIYYKHNHHAKCYANETQAIIGSMNIVAYSEINNYEMGVLLNAVTDKEAYLSCIAEINQIVEHATPKRILDVLQPKIENNINSSLNYHDVNKAWLAYLQKTFKDVLFKHTERLISGEDFKKSGVKFSNTYGFATVHLPFTLSTLKKVQEANLSLFQRSLHNYRLYWNSPFDKLCLYESKTVQFVQLQEKIDYYAEGLKILIACLEQNKLL